MIIKKYFLLILLALVFSGALIAAVPADVLAQTPPQNTGGGCPPPKNIGQLFSFAICLLTQYVVPFLFALALVMFLVGVVKYVKGGDNEEAREAGRGLMLFGIIALFVMSTVWGFVNILYNSFFGPGELVMPALPKQAADPFKY